MTPDLTFVMHQVGARGGAVGFDLPPAFHADALNVLYEPDTDCLPQIEERISGSALKTLVMPYALGERAERAAFHFNLDPYTNSFRRLNARYAGFSRFASDCDYTYGESMGTTRQAELEVRTIDGLAGGNQPTPPPDFLLVDTEGTAFEVLAGARDSLAARTLAVSAEIEFQPFWHDQKLFVDVWRLLDGLGFELIAFPMLSGASPHRAPVGLRGRELLICGDAMFLRRIDSLAAAIPDPDVRWVAACKLASVAFWLGFTEYGIEALAYADRLTPPPQLGAAAERVSYMRFLAELRDAMARTPARYPVTFGARYTTAEIQARHQPIHAAPVGSLKRWLRARPGLLAVVRAARRTPMQLKSRAGDAVRRARALGAPRYSAFERVFVKYGFPNVADLVRTRRLAETPFASAQA